MFHHVSPDLTARRMPATSDASIHLLNIFLILNKKYVANYCAQSLVIEYQFSIAKFNDAA